MSGLDVIAVLGLLASIEQLVEATYKVVNHAVAFYRNSKELPKTLEEVRTFLPFLAMAVRNRSDPSVLGRLNEEGRQALKSIFEDLKRKLQELQKLLHDYLPSEDASSSTKFLKAMGSLAIEKRIDKIMKLIFERYMPVLTLSTIDNQTLQTEVIKKAMETTSMESRVNLRQKPHFLVNVQRDDDFVGRQDIMSRLNALVNPVERHNRVALVALGGMGKTRIALECALKYKKSEDVSVYWVHASNASRIFEAYDEMARQVNIVIDTNSTTNDLQALQKDKMKAMKKWLESEASGRWLMIIDNADDRDLLYGEPKLAEYFPRSDNGSIIMTTRDKTVGLKFTGSASKIIIVEAFDNASSQSLLEAKLGSDIADEVSCRELSEELEGMPLALVQASAYINEQSISVQEYLALYRGSESSKINLLNEDFEDVVRNAQDTKSPIAVTWVISFEIIQKRDPLAAEILSKMCIMDSQALPLSLLDGSEDYQKLVKALGTLQAFSMITPRKADESGVKEKSFDLHRLVRLSMRNWLKMHTQLDYWTAMALKDMALKYPDTENTRWQHEEKWRAYLPHALTILASDSFTVTSEQSAVAEAFLPQALIGQHAADGTICGLCTADLMCRVSWTFDILERKSDRVLWAERGLSLREHILGPEHSDTVSAMMLYAKACLKVNRREEAENTAKRAIEIIARTQQPLPNQAKSLEAQAIIMSEYDQHEEAEGLYMQMVDLYRNSFGPEHNGTLAALDMLAFNCRQQGKYEEAEKIFKEVIEVRKRCFGPDYVDTLIVMSHLASLYFEMERYDEAVSLDTVVSGMWNNNVGPPHPGGVLAMGNLAADYFGQERYAEAAELGMKALKLQEEVSGPEDFETINTMSNLCSAYRKLRQFDEAERLGSRVLELHMKNAGPTHMLTSFSMGLNALIYEDQKKYVAAESLRKKALQITIDVYGVHHDQTFQCVKNLIGNYELQRRFADALTCELDFLCMVASALGPKHPDVVYRMSAVAAAQANQQQYNEAEQTARSAMKLAAECTELNQATAVYCKLTFGALTGRLGNYKEAERVYREVLEIYGKDQKPNNVGIAWASSNLATILTMLSQLEEGEKFAADAHAVLSELGNSMTMYSTWVLSWLFILTGRCTKAEGLQLDQLKMSCKQWTADETLQAWHFDILEAMARLGELYTRTQHHDKAYRIFSLVYKARAKAYGMTHSSTLDAMGRLGWNLAHLGQREEGIKYYLRAIEDYETLHPYNHSDIIYLKSALARLYNLNEQYDETETLVLELLSAESVFLLPKSIHAVFTNAALGNAYSSQGKLHEAEKTQLDALELMRELIGPANLQTIACMTDLAKTYERQKREKEAVALRLEAEELRKVADFGLSEEERRERGGLIETVIAWLEREVSDVEVWEP